MVYERTCICTSDTGLHIFTAVVQWLYLQAPHDCSKCASSITTSPTFFCATRLRNIALGTPMGVKKVTWERKNNVILSLGCPLEDGTVFLHHFKISDTKPGCLEGIVLVHDGRHQVNRDCARHSTRKLETEALAGSSGLHHQCVLANEGGTYDVKLPVFKLAFSEILSLYVWYTLVFWIGLHVPYNDRKDKIRNEA